MTSTEITEADRVEAIKNELRARAKAKRAAIGSQYRAEAAQKAAAHFFEAISLSPGQAVSVYWPIRDELDSKPLLIRLMDDGWPVGLPVVTGRDAPLVFRRWEDGAPLYPAGFGMLQPGAEAAELVPEVMVLPLLGFDRTGTRLGYGGAYYDRTLLALESRPLLVGYAFAAQEFETVPAEAHDAKLDLLITEEGVVRFTAAAG